MADLRHLARGALARAGFVVERVPDAQRLGRTHPDLEPEFAALYARCAPYTMTSVERMYALWQAVRHVVHLDVSGDLVECGVWRGGSSMLAALTLEQAGDRERTLWLYDTFAGMSEPDKRDVAVTGARMVDEWDAHRGRQDDPVFAFGALEEVRRNMASTGHAPERVRFVRGKVEDTIPAQAPERIALLRLDTDWYASTLHELEHLYERLAPGGVLVVDDYGHWEGARQAVDEFFSGLAHPPLLTRVDYTARIGIKR